MNRGNEVRVVLDDAEIEKEIARRVERARYILGLQQAHALLRTAWNNVKQATYAAGEDGVHAGELRSILNKIEGRMRKIETEIRLAGSAHSDDIGAKR